MISRNGLAILLPLLLSLISRVEVCRAAKASNNLIEREFEARASEHPTTTQSLRLKDGPNWLHPDTPQVLYRLLVADPSSGATQALTSLDPRQTVTSEWENPIGQERLTLRFVRENPKLEVVLVFECYPGHPFVRRWGAARNLGDSEVVIQKAWIEELRLAPGATNSMAYHGLERIRAEAQPRWFALHETDLSAKSQLRFETGRYRSATWLTLQRKQTPEGMVLGWETYAPTECVLDASGTLSVVLRAHLSLAPGENFEIPKSFVGLYRGDLDEGCYLTQRFAEERIAWPIPDDRFPYLMFNSWGYGTQINEALAREGIERCAELGVEVFVVDFGWEGPDWEPLPDKFPNGLAPLADLCHAKGMKFGVHLSFANISAHSKLYREHPEWTHGQGCWGYGHDHFPVYALSLGLPEARRWAVDTVLQVIDRDKVDWFLTDTHLYGFIDPAKHEVRGDQEYLAREGFAATLAEIHRLRPNVLIEHCDGGLSFPSYKMMEQHVTSITSDNDNALETRMAVYDLSHFLSPRFLDKYQQEWGSHHANRSCLFGGPWILMFPIHELRPGSREWNELLEDIALYKQTRKRIREGKALHLLPPSDPKDPSWDGWDAIGSYHPGEDSAVAFAYRTGGPHKTRTIPMKGLIPEHRYRVRLLDGGETREATGREILERGIRLSLEEYRRGETSRSSEVILIEPVR
ncbi:MAG: hypothetical protein GHCLOJNM_02042 [bacterium]|nr:hypothetical protein [bacterium]